MDCSLPGSSVHGILQARILERVAIFFSRGSSRPRNQTQVSSTAGRFFTDWAMREAQVTMLKMYKSYWIKEKLLDIFNRVTFFLGNYYVEEVDSFQN